MADTEFQPNAFEEVIVARSRPREKYEEVDGLVEFSDETASAVYVKGFAAGGGHQGTLTNLEGDLKRLTYFVLSRRFLELLLEAEEKNANPLWLLNQELKHLLTLLKLPTSST